MVFPQDTEQKKKSQVRTQEKIQQSSQKTHIMLQNQ